MIIEKWLMLPATELILVISLLFGATATLLCLLSFSRITRNHIQVFRGISASFNGSIVPILAILIGFLSSDVWESNKKAADLVREEAAELTSIYGLVAVSDLPYIEISWGIRNYVSAVVDKEWPAMTRGEAAAEAEIAQDHLIRIASNGCSTRQTGDRCNKALADIAMKLRETRSDRLKLSSDNTETIKWASVVFLALIAQVSIAILHIERIGPQIATLTIFSSAIVIVLGLIALHELPFAPPLVVKPTPLADLLYIMPDGAS